MAHGRKALPSPLDGPRPRGEWNRAVVGDGQPTAQCFAELCPPLLIQRHHIDGCRTLAAKKWHPVVVEVAEDRRHIDGARLDVLESGPGEKLREWFGRAEREATALVQRLGGGIERDRRVPEV